MFDYQSLGLRRIQALDANDHYRICDLTGEWGYYAIQLYNITPAWFGYQAGYGPVNETVLEIASGAP